jgi:hypothetical protein
MDKDNGVTASDHGSSLATSSRSEEKIKEALRSRFLQVYLDGVNEFGFHVLAMSTTSIPPDQLVEIAEVLRDQDLGFGQQIFDEAEKLGHEAGQAVVSRWTSSWDPEWGTEWELVGVDQLLTELICGTADEQRGEMSETVHVP